MDSKAVVQAFMDSMQKGDFEKCKSLLSADFQFSGPVPEPMNGEAWLGLLKIMKTAFPNIEWHNHIESMDGDTANISTKINGKNSGVLAC